MDLELKLRLARKAALQLVAKYGIERPEHIQLEDIAWDQGADIVIGQLDGAAARLSRIGERARIRLSDRIENLGHQRFSVAHELGHKVLKHETNIRLCDEKDLHSFQGGSTVEAEANAFASELLLPEPLVRKRCEVSPVSLDVVRQIAEDFSTSMTATTIRFAELTSERCATVYSVNGTVKWWFKSASFWPYIPKRPLDRFSLAYDYFHKGTLSEYRESVDVSAWLDIDGRNSLEEIYEHSMAIPSLDAVISLLWIPEQ